MLLNVRDQSSVQRSSKVLWQLDHHARCPCLWALNDLSFEKLTTNMINSMIKILYVASSQTNRFVEAPLYSFAFKRLIASLIKAPLHIFCTRQMFQVLFSNPVKSVFISIGAMLEETTNSPNLRTKQILCDTMINKLAIPTRPSSAN